MQDNQELKKIIFTIDLDLEELLEFMCLPISRLELQFPSTMNFFDFYIS